MRSGPSVLKAARSRLLLPAVALTGLGAASALLWSLRSEAPLEEAPGESTAAATPSPFEAPPYLEGSAPPRAELPDDFEPPPVLDGRYALRYGLEVAGSDGAGRPVSATMTLRGELHVEPRTEGEGKGARRWLEVSLEGAALTLDDTLRAMTDFPADGVAEQLRAPFVVQLERSGRVIDMRFGPGQSVAARGTFAAIVQAAQFVREDPAAAAYALPEWSVNGPVASSWVKRGEGEYAREWRRTDTLEAPDGEPKEVGDALGEGTILLEEARIAAVRAEQRGSARVGGGADQVLRYTATVQLTWTGGPVTVAARPPDELEPLIPDALDLQLPEEPALPLDDAIALVRAAAPAAVASQAAGWRERVASRKALASSLRAEPAMATRVVALFTEPGALEPVKRTVVEALAEADTPEAQRALAALLVRSDLPTADRIQVVDATVGVNTPRDELLDVMAGLAYEHEDKIYASQVAMVLGAAIATAAETDVELARAYLVPYLEQAAIALTPPPSGAPMRLEERGNWLGGLGNVASPGALPLILKGLDDEDEEIRASAAHALRFQDPTTTRERIQQLMHQDDAVPVRLAALHAAQYHGPAAHKALVERTLGYDPSENVRMEAAYVIASWLPEAPGLRLALASALEREPSLQVRDRLRNYLTPNRTAPPRQVIPTVNELIPEEYWTEEP